VANTVYTQDQKNAINHRGGNLLILACAGSGKTEVISRRIAGLVRDGEKKESIVAFTFTERAAGELKARIRQHLEELNPNDPPLGDMFVGTIHSFCLDTLRALDPSYRRYEVMDEARQAALIMTRFANFPEREVTYIGLDRLRSRVRGGGYWETVRTFITTLNVVHQKGITLEQLQDPILEDVIKRYRDAAHEWPNYFFDFNHIIDRLIGHLHDRPDHLEQVRSRLKHLVVDEYQDVDERQEQLIALLTDSGRRVGVTVVGDDDQAIYGWRGAEIKNILEFENRYPNVQKITLVDNFRSTSGIVEIANGAIRRIPEEIRLDKSMIARRPLHAEGDALAERLFEQGDIQVRTFPDERAEAEWIAERVLELRGAIVEERDGSKRAIDYADMAILLRSVRNAGHVFAEVLRGRDIPVVIKGVGGLFDHPEVQLIYACFCLLARTYYVKRTDSGIERLEELQTREEVRSLVSACGASLRCADANELLEWVASKREELDRRNLEPESARKLPRRIYPQDIFQEMLRTLGAHKADNPFDTPVLFNWGQLSGLITQFEAVHQWVVPQDLVSLCIFLGGWAAEGVDEGGLDEAFTPNAVQIMTVHAAKGLEWPVVFLPRVSSGNFPSQRRGDGPTTFLEERLFDRGEYASGDAGERRLWYVALTRCRKFLNITSPNRKWKRPTTFLKEISHDSVQRDGVIPKPQTDTPQPPAAVDLLPTTYTDLNSFWRCEHEYQLRSVMGFSPGVTESYGYGQQIHNILAELHKRAGDGEEFDEQKIDELVDARFHLRYTKDGDKYKPLTALKDAAKRALRNYVRVYAGFGKLVLEPEKSFEFVDKDSGALISGVIDLLEKIEQLPSGDVKRVPVALVDFKTTRFKDMESFKEAKSAVEQQLQLYAVAVRQALGMDALRARAHFLMPRELSKVDRDQGMSDVVDIDISPHAQSAIGRKVKETVRRIETDISTGAFKKTGIHRKACRICDFREMCHGFVQYKKEERQRPRAGTYEEEREAEMQQLREELDAGTQTE